jgi:hypothetical protein
MTGGEIIPTSKVAVGAANAVLGADKQVKQQLLELAKDSPAMKAAAEDYARRIALKQAILRKLYEPLAKWMGASTAYFETDFATDMSEKLVGIPEEHLSAPEPSVAIPAMQGLGYSLGEPALKEMYLNLLTAATDDRVADTAHPSFAEIIRQLSARETPLLTEVLLAGATPTAQLHRKRPDRVGTMLSSNHVVNVRDATTNVPVELPLLAMWIDNWVRLGLVDADYTHRAADTGAYDWIQHRPEFLRLVDSDPRGADSVQIGEGIIQPTDFGKTFASVVAPGEVPTTTNT